MKRFTQTLFPILVIGGLALFGMSCEHHDRDKIGESINTQLEGAITLSRAKSCEDLETTIKDAAREQVELAYQHGGSIYYYPAVDVDTNGVPTGGSGQEPSNGGGEDKGASDFTGTNVQEEGVDEADIVKTDGNILYALRYGDLVITDAWPPEEAQVLTTVPIEGTGLEMLYTDDVLVVFSSVPSWDTATQQRLGIDHTDEVVYRGWSLVKVTVFDVTDPAEPTLVREQYLEGEYVSSRMIGATVRVIIRTQASMMYDMGYATGGGGSGGGGVTPVEPTDAGTTEPISSDAGAPDPVDTDVVTTDTVIGVDEVGPEPKDPALEEAKAKLLAAIDNTTLGDWLARRWEVTIPGDNQSPIVQNLLSNCEDHYKQSLGGGIGFLSVATFDLTQPTVHIPAVTVFGQGHIVYASPKLLYVASDLYTSGLFLMADAEQDWQVTVIHGFDITSTGLPVQYVGSGKVPGHILNQFSMGEWQNHLRVATTKELWVGEAAHDNFVTVLTHKEGELVQTGQIAGIAKGERIYSARFVGDKGFMVTFQQVDPLFTLDLADPTHPTIVGELKVPGFSTYIHPVGDTHLLTIGQETVDHGTWVGVEGMKLELFDVTDFANPKSVHKFVFDQGYYSEALYEHKAFTFHAEKGWLAIPVSGYGMPINGGGPDIGAPEPQNEYKVGLGVFKVDVETGITEHGFINHGDLGENYYNEQVRRSVLMDEYIYSIGRIGMKVCTTDTLNEVRKVVFPPDTSGNWWGEEKPLPDDRSPL